MIALFQNNNSPPLVEIRASRWNAKYYLMIIYKMMFVSLSWKKKNILFQNNTGSQLKNWDTSLLFMQKKRQMCVFFFGGRVSTIREHTQRVSRKHPKKGKSYGNYRRFLGTIVSSVVGTRPARGDNSFSQRRDRWKFERRLRYLFLWQNQGLIRSLTPSLELALIFVG